MLSFGEKRMSILSEEFIRHHIQGKGLEFTPTQTKISIPIVNRLYKKMKAGIAFPEIKTHKKLLMDGHHRYISALLADFHIKKVPYPKTSSTTAHLWSEVVFDEQDWDTKEEIKRLNTLDAVFNGVSVEEIEKIIQSEFIAS